MRPAEREGSDRAHAKRTHLGLHTLDPRQSGYETADAISSQTSSRHGGAGVLGRVALVAASAYAFSLGFKIHDGPGSSWAILEALVYALALGCLVAAFVVTTGWSRRVQSSVGLVLGAVIAVSVSYEITVLHPEYGTDVIAFAHASAEVILDGDNPYQTSREHVEQAADRFGVTLTETADGGEIDWLISYPALHSLTYTAFVGLGFPDLRWGTLIVELVSLAVIWRALSPMGRLAVPLVLLAEPYLTVVFTGGGVTDWLWVLPVALSAVSLQKERFGYAGLFLGLACAVKQHPWFAVPFVLIWVIRTATKTSLVSGMWARPAIGGFIAGLFAGFVIPNLPFFIWAPSAWTNSVLSPALGNLAPDGHGLSSLVSEGLVQLPALFYSILIATTLVGIVVAYARYFDRLKEALWVLPAVVMFFSYRSLHSYFVFWLPIAALWLDLRFAKRSVADTNLVEQVRGTPSAG